jgi:hypothetical protein
VVVRAASPLLESLETQLSAINLHGHHWSWYSDLASMELTVSFKLAIQLFKKLLTTNQSIGSIQKTKVKVRTTLLCWRHCDSICPALNTLCLQLFLLENGPCNISTYTRLPTTWI